MAFASRGSYMFTLYFDVIGERFREIVLLGNHFSGIPINFNSIMVSKGFLALIIFGEGEAIVGSEICCIWVMEYGCIESWTKQVVLPLHQVSQFFGFVNNDEILIDRFGRLVCLNA